MAESLHASLLFLINTVFDIYLFILTVRFILVWLGFNYFDPITQVIVKLTDVVVKPTRKFLPTVRHFELSSLTIIILLALVKLTLLSALSFGMPTIPGLIALTLAETIRLFLDVFFYAILLGVIISWVQPHAPVAHFLQRFNSPIMRPIQRIIPPIGGIDISPIPALILLKLLTILIVNPLSSLGLTLAIGS